MLVRENRKKVTDYAQNMSLETVSLSKRKRSPSNLNSNLSSLIIWEENEKAKLMVQQHNLHVKTDSSGNTALHYCAQYGNHTIAKYLLDNNCNINAQDLMGYTPLMDALRGQHERVIEILLEYGADVLLMNNEGKSTLQFFFERRAQKSFIVKLIIERVKNQCSNSEEVAKKLIDAGCRIDQAFLSDDVKIVQCFSMILAFRSIARKISE